MSGDDKSQASDSDQESHTTESLSSQEEDQDEVEEDEVEQRSPRQVAAPSAHSKTLTADNGASGDDDSEEDEEEVSSNEGGEGSDDPLGAAYCLDDGSPISDTEEDVLPWRSDVKTPREFFSTEILYRYDILEPHEQDALKGTYRLELKGQDGGIWSIVVDQELRCENAKDQDADIVLSMHGKDFMNLINGRLNPQLAILAQRIKVKGDTRRAVIFQSLLTPTAE